MSGGVSNSAQQVAINRAQSPHPSMFLRMLVRAAVLRRGRAASALLAMIVAAAVTTAMLNLYVTVSQLWLPVQTSVASSGSIAGGR